MIQPGQDKEKFSLLEGKTKKTAKKAAYKQKITHGGCQFSLDDIIGNYSQAKENRVNKRKVILGPERPKHRRQPSVIIRNLSEIYSFDENWEDESIDEEVIEVESKQKNSNFSSTIDPKSTLASVFKQTCTENEIFKNLSMDVADLTIGVTKPDEHLDTFTYNTVEGISELFDIGIIPSFMYCERCKSFVNTEVKIKMPTLPFWKLVCCLRNFVGLCEKNEEKYQEFEHSCIKCGKVLVVRSFNN